MELLGGGGNKVEGGVRFTPRFYFRLISQFVSQLSRHGYSSEIVGSNRGRPSRRL
jgi:hypothetical protein